jgi:putative membrane protein
VDETTPHDRPDAGHTESGPGHQADPGRATDAGQGRTTDGQRAGHWSQLGSDPDYRFSLANERTFLAWVRTALAFIAGAVALEQLVPSFTVHGVRAALSVLLALFGLVAAVGAYRHWARSERAMRLGEPLPRSPLMLGLTIGLVVVAAVVAVTLLVQAA